MNKHIIEEINSYMLNPLKYAILLEGTWGCGKTFFIKNELNDIDKYYISLNGISSISALSFQLICQISDKKNNSGNKFIKKIGSYAVSFLDKKLDNYISEVISSFDSIDLNNKLIIFDDLERCSLPLDEVLGFINNMVENNNIKVLLIANEAELIGKPNYLKIKEKLIYQTLKYEPNFENLYDVLKPKRIEEVSINKDFCINELKRKKHYNLRTLQFIFQRYVELRKLLNSCFKKIKCNIFLKKQIYNDVFQYMIVACRDYKNGENINKFKDNSQMSYYQLDSTLSNAITSFKFVNDFINGVYIDENIIVEVLKGYINELKSSSKESSALNILNRWWESDDDEIIENTNSILNNLSSNSYSFDLYPRIIIYLIKITNIGFSSNILDQAVISMKKNIRNCSEYVTLGYRAIDDNLSDEENGKFKKIRKQIIDCIDEHNHIINKDGANNVKNKEIGEKGKYLYNWCNEFRTDLIDKKRFLQEVGIDNIIYIVDEGNSKDINYLIYLLNDTYSYNNFEEIYPTEYDDLVTLKNKLLKCDTSNFGKTKIYAYNRLCSNINTFIEYLFKHIN